MSSWPVVVAPHDQVAHADIRIPCSIRRSPDVQAADVQLRVVVQEGLAELSQRSQIQSLKHQPVDHLDMF